MHNGGDNPMATLLKSLKILFSKIEPTINSEVFLQLLMALLVSLKKAYTTFNRNRKVHQPKHCLWTMSLSIWDGHEESTTSPVCSQSSTKSFPGINETWMWSESIQWNDQYLLSVNLYISLHSNFIISRKHISATCNGGFMFIMEKQTKAMTFQLMRSLREPLLVPW